MNQTTKHYTQEDHTVRRTMVQRQRETINKHDCASQHFVDGRDNLWLCHETVPQRQETQQKIQKHVPEWSLEPAVNPYLSWEEWFDALSNRIFPVTDYIRPMKEIDYTPLPDLFHEYFWHMPAMTLQSIADLEYITSQYYKQAQSQQQRDAIFALSWFSIEYGLIREQGKVKAFWAWLMSSPWDLQHFCEWWFALEDATIQWIIQTKPSPHKQHKKLFVFDSILQFNTLLEEYVLTQ